MRSHAFLSGLCLFRRCPDDESGFRSCKASRAHLETGGPLSIVYPRDRTARWHFFAQYQV